MGSTRKQSRASSNAHSGSRGDTFPMAGVRQSSSPSAARHDKGGGNTAILTAINTKDSRRNNAGLPGTAESNSPGSSVSEESLDAHNENQTPPESPLGSVPAARLARMSLEEVRPPRPRPESKKTPSPTTPSGTAVKRNAPAEPSIATGDLDPTHSSRDPDRWSTGAIDSPGSKRPRTGQLDPPQPHVTSPRRIRAKARGVNPASGKALLRTHAPTKVKDWGPDPDTIFHNQREASLSTLGEVTAYEKNGPPWLGKKKDYKTPTMILQPESSPISQDQLAAEVKAIYAGLVMVEAKCINIDAAQAADPHSELTKEQWQALIALHRTLLYEHHDFLMATHHPVATPALRGLAARYSMPARMWRHAIHSFLEVLRFRRPASQDYMLAFIYLAYQMVALLFETVPMFTDTWIECLGDLARYRMAIEDNREQHSIWGGVAGRWYSTASDRHPEIGRLYHHLGILERPSVRKFFLYTKSLTVLVPFPNAKDSLSTLCTPIVESERHYYTDDTSIEAGLVIFHASVYSNCDAAVVKEAAAVAMSRLRFIEPKRVLQFGVELVISNIGALLQLGAARNALWQRFGKAINEDIQHSRPSAEISGPPMPILTDTEKQLMTLSTSQPSACVTAFVYSSFVSLIRVGKDRRTMSDLLPTVHAVLLWFYSLHSLESRNHDQHHLDKSAATDEQHLLPGTASFSWTLLAKYLNLLLEHEPIAARTLQFARQGMFLAPERAEDARPLREDYTFRGLVWTPALFPSGWFSEETDDGERDIEDDDTHKARCERVQWLALWLAFRIGYLKFDTDTRSFCAPGGLTVEEVDLEEAGQESEHTKTTGSRGSSSPSVHSDDDGAVVITMKRKPSKSLKSPDGSVDVVDPESHMPWQECQ